MTAFTGMLAAASISAKALTGMAAAASTPVKWTLVRAMTGARSPVLCASGNSRNRRFSHPNALRDSGVGRQAKLDRRRQAKLYHLGLKGNACHERIS